MSTTTTLPEGYERIRAEAATPEFIRYRRALADLAAAASAYRAATQGTRFPLADLELLDHIESLLDCDLPAEVRPLDVATDLILRGQSQDHESDDPSHYWQATHEVVADLLDANGHDREAYEEARVAREALS